MNPSNVVPFESALRKAMARRGAPDKIVCDSVEIDCPYCRSKLYLDQDVLCRDSEVPCSRCHRVIGLARPEAADSGG